MKRQLNIWFLNDPTPQVYIAPQGWAVRDSFLFINMGRNDVHAFNLTTIQRFEYEENDPCDSSSVA